MVFSRMPSTSPRWAASAPDVPQDLARGVLARGAHDAAAGMRAGAAQVETADRRAVVRPARGRTEEEQLIGGHLAVEDVPLGETEDLLQIPRAEDLARDDRLLDVRGVFRQRVDDLVAHLLADLGPGQIGRAHV